MPIVLDQAAPPAASAPAPPRAQVITQPDWLSKPSGEDMSNFYPKDAANNRIEGGATISCEVDAAGTLVNCAATSETPPGAGFGAAALSLAGKFKMRPLTKDGVPAAGGHVRIPIRFILPKQTIMPSFAVTMRCYGYAAAASEAGDTSDDAQTRLAAWRLLLVAQTAAERQRPSEFEGLLVVLRKTGAERLNNESFKAERDECATAFPGNVGDVTGIIRQARPDAR